MTDGLLTKEDKINMINSHIRSIEINKYTCELSILEQEALDTPDQNHIEIKSAQIAQYSAQLAALNLEKNNLIDGQQG